MDIPNTWPNCGHSPVRAVLAEAVTAELASTHDTKTLWPGGQKSGYDVMSMAGRHDAKHVDIDKDGFIVLARWNAVPFNPTKVDRLMLVHLSATTSYSVDLLAGTVDLTAHADILDVW